MTESITPLCGYRVVRGMHPEDIERSGAPNTFHDLHVNSQMPPQPQPFERQQDGVAYPQWSTQQTCSTVLFTERTPCQINQQDYHSSSQQPTNSAITNYPHQYDPNATLGQQQVYGNLPLATYYSCSSSNNNNNNYTGSYSITMDSLPPTNKYVQNDPYATFHPQHSSQDETDQSRNWINSSNCSTANCHSHFYSGYHSTAVEHLLMPPPHCHITPLSPNPNVVTIPTNYQSQLPMGNAIALAAASQHENAVQEESIAPISNNPRPRILHFKKSLEDDYTLSLLVTPQPNLSDVLNDGANLFQSICIGGSQHGKTFMHGEPSISMQLKQQDIWEEIFIHIPEMITTRVGRRIFPSLSVSIKGLDPTSIYTIAIDLVQLRPDRMRYDNDIWTATPSDKQYPPPEGTQPLFYVQEHSPQTGEFWISNGVDLTAAKIIHRKEVERNENMIFVYTQRQYIPRMHILRHLRANGIEEARYDLSTCPEHIECVGSYIFPGTEFIVGTSYQNPRVAEINTLRNPFARRHRNRHSEIPSASILT